MNKSLKILWFVTAGLIMTSVMASPLSAKTKPIKAKKISHKPASIPHSSNLTVSQKAAALAAIKALSKLQAATEVGVSYVDYGTRLIDAKADVTDSLANLADGQLKQKLSLAMDAYVDAHTAWGEILEYGFWDVLKIGETGKIVSKYKLDEGEDPVWSWDAKDSGKEYQQEMATHIIPLAIWKIANDDIIQAKALVK